jgi:hypothetical protein
LWRSCGKSELSVDGDGKYVASLRDSFLLPSSHPPVPRRAFTTTPLSGGIDREHLANADNVLSKDLAGEAKKTIAKEASDMLEDDNWKKIFR